MTTLKSIPVAALLLLFAAVPATATTFDITGQGKAFIEGQQNFEQGSPGSPFLSSDLGTVTSVVGTFDLHTGTLDATLVLALSPEVAALNESLNNSTADRVFELSATGFEFDSMTGSLVTTGWGTITALGDAIFSLVNANGLPSSTPGNGSTFAIDFLPAVEANTLTIGGVVNGDAVLNLWGFAQNTQNGLFALGTDLNLVLTAVPIPAAAFLFGSGLLALFGIRQRKIFGAKAAA